MLNINDIPSSGLKIFISELSKKHGVRYARTGSTVLAQAITRLSDDDIAPDDTEKLVIALKKAKVINGSEMLTLLGRYFDENRHVRSL